MNNCKLYLSRSLQQGQDETITFTLGVVVECSAANDSTTLTSEGGFSQVEAGDEVTGDGIPTGTAVLSKLPNSESSLTLSNATTSAIAEGEIIFSKPQITKFNDSGITVTGWLRDGNVVSNSAAVLVTKTTADGGITVSSDGLVASMPIAPIDLAGVTIANEKAPVYVVGKMTNGDSSISRVFGPAFTDLVKDPTATG